MSGGYMANFLTSRNQINADPFEDLFKGFMISPFQMETTTPQIRMDVKEDDYGYRVDAEIPGVEKTTFTSTSTRTAFQ
jgi:HSP20 family molecular chaperone IbpA